MSRRSGNRGFTLVELLIVMVVFGVVVTGALGFMAVQSKAFYRGSDRMTALQNLRYALQRAETDLQTVGTNVPDGQPSLVYADDDVIAFNADYATNVPGDIFSVFYEPRATAGAVSALRSPLTIPNSSFGYGDTLYHSPPGSATESPAEFIAFFFASDTSTARTDDYALYRKVNSLAPEMVARHILKAGSEPFFRYFHHRGTTGTATILDSIADTTLPVRHSTKKHQSKVDTGTVALIDEVRAVRVTLKATNGLTGPDERTAELSRVISMRNVGQSVLQTCGDSPILGSVAFGAVAMDTDPSPTEEDWQIRLTWSPATDETLGELDVYRYVLWRRDAAAGPWGDPFLSIPAGQATYTYDDASVVSGTTYQYQLAAQDCTPAMSGTTASALVAIP